VRECYLHGVGTRRRRDLIRFDDPYACCPGMLVLEARDGTQIPRILPGMIRPGPKTPQPTLPALPRLVHRLPLTRSYATAVPNRPSPIMPLTPLEPSQVAKHQKGVSGRPGCIERRCKLQSVTHIDRERKTLAVFVVRKFEAWH
jgi:hypothetical protein